MQYEILSIPTHLEVAGLSLLLAAEGDLGRPAGEEVTNLLIGNVALLKALLDCTATRVAGAVLAQPLAAQQDI